MRVDILSDQKDKSVYVEIHCSNVTDEISKLKRHIQNYSSYIPASIEGTNVNIRLDDILYIEAVDKKNFIYTEAQVYLTGKRLYELEDLLDKRDFFRCSKSVIVNVSKIIKLKPEITRNILATMVNGEVIVVSRRYVSELKEMLKIG